MTDQAILDTIVGLGVGLLTVLLAWLVLQTWTGED